MALTYEPIQTTTLTSAQASVTFSSVPSTYTDLILVCVFGVTTGDDIAIRFNGDTGTNYSSTRMWGTGTVAASNRETNLTGIRPRTPLNQDSTITTEWRVSIMNYANTITNKTTIARYDSPGAFTEADVGLWRSTSAINSITVKCDTQSFVTGSVFTLYGIKAA